MRAWTQWLPAFALSIGPCAVWLVWCVVNRRWVQASFALVANFVLWTAGPAFLVWAHSAHILDSTRAAW